MLLRSSTIPFDLLTLNSLVLCLAFPSLIKYVSPFLRVTRVCQWQKEKAQINVDWQFSQYVTLNMNFW